KTFRRGRLRQTRPGQRAKTLRRIRHEGRIEGRQPPRHLPGRAFGGSARPWRAAAPADGPAVDPRGLWRHLPAGDGAAPQASDVPRGGAMMERSELVAVHLHGPLAKEFGAVHRFAVRDPREAARALAANFPAFEAAFRKYEPYY